MPSFDLSSLIPIVHTPIVHIPPHLLLPLYILCALLLHLVFTDPNPTQAEFQEPLLVQLTTNPKVFALIRHLGITIPILQTIATHLLTHPPTTLTHNPTLLSILTAFLPTGRERIEWLNTICPRHTTMGLAGTSGRSGEYATRLPPSTLLALGMIIVGATLRLVCFFQLRDAFTFHLHRPRNGLVKTGFYKYVRHPSYTFASLAGTGMLLLITGSLWYEFEHHATGSFVGGGKSVGGGGVIRCFLPEDLAVVVARVLFAIWIGGVSLLVSIRVRKEEEMLEKTFGEEYRKYKKQTKRFIPWVW